MLTVEFMALNCSCSRFTCCVKVDGSFLIKHVFCGRSQTDLSSLGLDSLLLLAVSLAVEEGSRVTPLFTVWQMVEVVEAEVLHHLRLLEGWRGGC